ncbi:Thioredoxin [Patulibacter medicamentivorans]|jgi:thioredoxin 1|uniref:Thioredoxin n=1 Tax=Patulibacter medicamentivorans TaxID=1097667 RepID=H0E4T8_9ACTN|nr:thioredoxin [Patulibacter medicamentivorans]EHN11306.1 Thioredoxin [Patulibacter medicamentivorans]
MAGSVPEVTDTNFQAEVIEHDQATLVDFWAPWCGPCRAVSPVLEEIDGEREDVRVVKLNTDDNQQTAAKYGIMSIPTMIVFKNGQAVGQIVGAMPKPRLNAEIDRILA